MVLSRLGSIPIISYDYVEGTLCVGLCLPNLESPVKQKKVIIHCDNLPVVYAVNNGSSKCESIMALVRRLFYVAARGNFECKLVHVEGKRNIAADMLSRRKIQNFKKTFPQYNVSMSTPAASCK